MAGAASPGMVPGAADSRTREGEGGIDPAAQYVAELITHGLDENENLRDELIKLRTSPGTTPARRRLIDNAIGRLARAHVQLSGALRDVEQAGGAA